MSDNMNHGGNYRIIDSLVSIIRNGVQQQQTSKATNDEEPSDFPSVLVRGGYAASKWQE